MYKQWQIAAVAACKTQASLLDTTSNAFTGQQASTIQQAVDPPWYSKQVCSQTQYKDKQDAARLRPLSNSTNGHFPRWTSPCPTLTRTQSHVLWCSHPYWLRTNVGRGESGTQHTQLGKARIAPQVTQDRWMDGWMDRWADGWTNGWISEDFIHLTENGTHRELIANEAVDMENTFVGAPAPPTNQTIFILLCMRFDVVVQC